MPVVLLALTSESHFRDTRKQVSRDPSKSDPCECDITCSATPFPERIIPIIDLALHDPLVREASATIQFSLMN